MYGNEKNEVIHYFDSNEKNGNISSLNYRLPPITSGFSQYCVPECVLPSVWLTSGRFNGI